MTKHSATILRVVRILVACAWVAVFLFVITWVSARGIPAREYPQFIVKFLREFGVYGPFFVLLLYLARSIVFVVPISIFTIVIGAVYGPVWGTLLNLLGENLCATAAFGIARLVGRRYVRERESGWLKRMDHVFRQEGFLSVVCMRILLFPFDCINYGAGVSGIVYRQYALGTLLGTIPSTVTLTVLGGAFMQPRALVWFVALFVISVGSAILLRRSAWVRRRLYPSHVVEHV